MAAVKKMQEHAKSGRGGGREHLVGDNFIKKADLRMMRRFKWHEQMF